MAEQFDLVVIGGGNGGYIPAIRASQLGMSVALIEKREGGHLGGTCLNVGCIPTKALLHTAHLLHDARNGEDFGVKVGEVEFDYPQAAKRREQVVSQLRRGVQGLMKKNKVTVYNGVGSFVEPKKIKVETEDGEEELEAENVLISTGSAVNTLPGLEFDGEKVISSDDIVTNDESYPESVIILGSGAVGVEFASMYNDFGTEVTIVEILDRIVPLEDPEISEALRKEFEDRGIRVLTSTKADPESLEKTDSGIKITVAGAGSGEQEETEGEGGSYGGEDPPTGEAERSRWGDPGGRGILVAVGRKTVTEGLNLDVTSVEVDDRGIIQVDEYRADGRGRRVRGRGRHRGLLARPRGRARGHHRRRAHGRRGPDAHGPEPRPARHLLQARGGLFRAHQGSGRGGGLRGQGDQVPVQGHRQSAYRRASPTASSRSSPTRRPT